MIYRLYLSPISAFPGPKLAALTFWYEFYYDVYPLYGQYTFHIRDLHEQYGPIVRINPYALHISTPQFYDTLYASTKHTNKWYWFTRVFGMDGSTFATSDHDRHRSRRAAMSPFFSMASVRRLQPMIEERVQALLKRLSELKGSGVVLRMPVVVNAFSNDVIMAYTFGRSYHRLEVPDFDPANHESMHEGSKMLTLMTHAILLFRTIQSLPEFLLSRMGYELATLVELKNSMRRQVIQVMSEKNDAHKDLSHPTIFHALLSSDLPPEDKGVERLTEEAHTIIAAGQETLSLILTFITFHLLSNPVVLRKLKEELAKAIPDPEVVTPEATLANLPYLTGVIKEGLRLGYGICGRLYRVPQEHLTFSAGDCDWIIPPGTPVCMTSALIHHDESVFPNSNEFRPERWIEDPRLDRYLVSFSKGNRSCLGINLAYAEMYLWLAGIFRRYGSPEVRFESDLGAFELFDTDISDVEMWADRFIPVTKPASKRLRIRVIE
ncbi:cytochrome P450 [Hyaloscypha variabilis F]|uniref:Cytochrome P450 n=1 Tax=Hyaloscypha variabilis (strain UAMH 11265 / GT02V1 / F) TaxID=1149755 RepID=A0A2J6RRE8_HYAVF|nr:cytochrome P450 [Hyaloscypha variabilis F]